MGPVWRVLLRAYFRLRVLSSRVELYRVEEGSNSKSLKRHPVGMEVPERLYLKP